MARSFTAANSDIAYHDAMPYGSQADFCFSFFLYSPNTTAALIFEYDQTNGFDYGKFSRPPGDFVRSYSVAGGWGDDTAAGVSTPGWHHHFLVIPCDGEGIPPPSPLGLNQVWFDGVKQTLIADGHTSAGPVAATSPFSIMGRRVGGINSVFATGIIAEWAVWSSHTMLAAPGPFVAALAAGANPMRVRSTELIAYVPWFGADSPEPDYQGGRRNFTLAGSSVAAPHPPTARSLVNFQD